MSKEKTYKNFKGGLTIIKEYSELIPSLTKEKFAKLKANIKQDKAILDPLIVTDQNIILDGHNRYNIAEQLDMSFKTETLKMESMEEGIIWIIRHQIGRRDMTKDQLAVIGLSLIPHYRKMMKDRQSKGGKGKEKMGKNLKTSQLVAKDIGVNENLIKTVTSLNKDIPEIIPMIREGELLANEGKYLRNVCAKGAIVVDGKFTKDALTKLKAFRNPVLTPAEKKAQDLEKELSEQKKKVVNEKKKKDKADKDAKDKAEADAIKEAAKKKAEADLKEANENEQGVDPNSVSGTGGGGGASNVTGGLTEGNKETLSDDHLRKLSIFASRIDGEVKNEKENKVFTEKAGFIDAIEKSKMITEGFIEEYVRHKNAKTESGYPPNMVIAVPNTQLYRGWHQKASSVSALYCDSKKLPVRLLYFGDEDGAFIDHFKQYGNVSIITKGMPNVSDFSESLMSNIKETLNPDNKADIETLTPPKVKTTLA